jgi:hypothetical protein
MNREWDQAVATANATRYRATQRSGHYESFFQRANHPTRPLAFWIRYTIFSPDHRPQDALGELWAIFFDGESGRHVAVKREVSFSRCSFSNAELLADVDGARLEPGKLRGSAATGDHSLRWDLTFTGAAAPLFLLPLRLYRTTLPSAKSLVALPLARYRGDISVDGRRVEVADWIGSHNHNWGRKHTDEYRWGQVAGFDTHPDSFLEVASARLKIGPLWTPIITLIVLRHNGEELRLNGLLQGIRADSAFEYFRWSFRSATGSVRVDGHISAPREAFVGLAYRNPPGGTKHCLNSKLAACKLRVSHAGAGAAQTLSTRHRAAFEILTDDRGHGVAIRA